MKRSLERPLTDVNRIILRQSAIEELTQHMTELSRLEEMLSGVFDFERILSRIEANSTSPKDLLSLKATLRVVPQVKQLLSGAGSVLLKKLNNQLSTHGPVFDLLDRAMNENGTGNIKDGKYIREGFSAELDEVRSLSENSQKYIQELEEKEKKRRASSSRSASIMSSDTILRSPMRISSCPCVLCEKADACECGALYHAGIEGVRDEGALC